MLRFHFSIERWKFNKEYSIYVSTWGNIKDGKKKDKNVYADHGYLFVEVDKKLVPVHRLVMETFKPQKLNLTVDHIDHNTRNNHISNLRWLSKEENENDNNREKVFKEVKKQEEKTFTNWRKKIKKCAQKHTENYQGGGFFTIQKDGDNQIYHVNRKSGREFARLVNENGKEANEVMRAIKGDYCNPHTYNGFIYTWYPSYADYLRVNKKEE